MTAHFLAAGPATSGPCVEQFLRSGGGRGVGAGGAGGAGGGGGPGAPLQTGAQTEGQTDQHPLRGHSDQ